MMLRMQKNLQSIKHDSSKRDLIDNRHESIEYGYDSLNRLTSASEIHGFFKREYGYDSLGNLVHETEVKQGNSDRATTVYSIDGLNRLISKNASGVVHDFEYDKRGNLIKDSVATYTYDASNRMVRGVNAQGQESIYNFNGIGALVNNSGTYNKDYVLDYTAFVPTELMETQNDIIQRYVYGGHNKISSAVASGNDTANLQHHTDRLGSTVFITDNIGNIQSVTQYDEWGNIGKSRAFKLTGKELDIDYSYTGHAFDTVLNSYYAKARMYSAENRRFEAEDIIKGSPQNPISLVAYIYGYNSPIRYIDPDGAASIDGLNAIANTYRGGLLPDQAVLPLVLLNSSIRPDPETGRGRGGHQMYTQIHQVASVFSAGSIQNATLVELEKKVADDLSYRIDIAAKCPLGSNWRIWEVKPPFGNPEHQLALYQRHTGFDRGERLNFQENYRFLSLPGIDIRMILTNNNNSMGGVNYSFKMNGDLVSTATVAGIVSANLLDILNKLESQENGGTEQGSPTPAPAPAIVPSPVQTTIVGVQPSPSSQNNNVDIFAGFATGFIVVAELIKLFKGVPPQRTLQLLGR